MSKERTRVYAWEFPVRFTHWINFLCIFTLSITGYYIGDPFIHALSSKQYIMGWVRFIHFVAAYAFLLSMIIRLYWAFAGGIFTGVALPCKIGRKMTICAENYYLRRAGIEPLLYKTNGVDTATTSVPGMR